MTQPLRTTPLADRNVAGAWPDERAAVNVAIGILIGLEDLHAQGGVMGALTPSLVGVRDDGAVVLNRPDPATAASLDARYASPESMATGEATQADDVYSCGAMLYEMLAGHPPTSAGSAAGPTRDLVQTRPGIHPQLAAVVMRSVDEQPGQRYQTAGAFRADLEAVRSLLTPAPVTAPVAEAKDNRGPIALIILGALILAGILAWLLLRGDEVEVPAVAGQPLAIAQQRLQDADLIPTPVPERSDTVPEGTAIRTDPPAGTKVDKESTVTLYVSGQAPATGMVPSVTGQQQAQAMAAIQAAGYTAQVTQAPSSDPAGTVIQQAPAAGERAEPGATVMLTVSSGDGQSTVTQTETETQTQTQTVPAPAPTPAPTPDPSPETTTVTTQAPDTTVQVPTITGMTLDAATRRLEDAGLRVGTATEQPGSQPAGTVLQQNPTAGTRVDSGTDVAVVVSNGQP